MRDGNLEANFHHHHHTKFSTLEECRALKRRKKYINLLLSLCKSLFYVV